MPGSCRLPAHVRAPGTDCLLLDPEPKIVEDIGGNEGARCEAQGKRPLEGGSRGEGLTQKKRLASGPRGGNSREVMKAGPRGPSSSAKVRMIAEAQSGIPERGNVEDYHLGLDPGASASTRA